MSIVQMDNLNFKLECSPTGIALTSPYVDGGNKTWLEFTDSNHVTIDLREIAYRPVRGSSDKLLHAFATADCKACKGQHRTHTCGQTKGSPTVKVPLDTIKEKMKGLLGIKNR